MTTFEAIGVGILIGAVGTVVAQIGGAFVATRLCERSLRRTVL